MPKFREILSISEYVDKCSEVAFGGLFFDVFMYLKCEISFPNCLTIWYNRNGLMEGQWETNY